MIGREKRVLLRHYLERGLSKSSIARQLGISRRTVYHWIKTGQLDRELDDLAVSYGPRRPMPSKLDPYKAMIRARLQSYPRLSATRLHAEVQAAGYPGSYTQVKRYVRKVRPQAPADPVVRFETPPGKQAQVDFAEFRMPWGKRYALLVVLGWSRFSWIGFYPRQTMRVLVDGLEAAFRAFGGVPEELLFDQMKAVIVDDRRTDGGQLIENSEFLRFAHHWGFRTRACRPYRAKTKGKVERPIRYLRENFVYGREFISDSDLDDQLQRWLATVANVRIHRTTRERPVERLVREHAALRPLALRPYRSLVLTPPSARSSSPVPSVPRITVERRALERYAQIAAGGR